MLADGDVDGAVCCLRAGEVDAGEPALPLGEGVAVVGVDVALAGLARRVEAGGQGVDAQGQRTLRSFGGALGEWRDGEDSAAADVDGQRLQLWSDGELLLGDDEVALLEVERAGGFAAGELLAGPVVVPGAGGQIDGVGCDFLGRGVRRDEEAAAEEELAST